MPQSDASATAPPCDALGLGALVLDTIGSVKDFPEPDQKTRVYEMTRAGGGPASTAMVTCRRLGLRSAVIAKIGDDPEGEELRAGLEREGVDASGLIVGRGQRSMVAFCFAQIKTGRRIIYYHRSQLPRIHPDQLDVARIRQAPVLLVDGMELKAGARAAELVRAAGGQTVFDGGSVRSGVDEVLPQIDHLVVSWGFARDKTGCDEPLAALEALRWSGHHRVVIITLGEEGYVGAEGGREPFQANAFHVQAVDTTGAGDVFHGAYCAGLFHRWPARQCAAFASACAALKCTRMGGQAAIPTMDEALAFCRQHARGFDWPGRPGTP